MRLLEVILLKYVEMFTKHPSVLMKKKYLKMPLEEASDACLKNAFILAVNPSLLKN